MSSPGTAPSSPVPTSSSSSSATTSAKMTPSNNNYAAPNTPIASAKRPRNQNSAIKSNGKTMTNGRRSRSSIGTSQHTYGREIVNNGGSSETGNNSNDAYDSSSSQRKGEELSLTPVRKMKLTDDDSHDRIPMSPMHKPRPVTEKEKNGNLNENQHDEEHEQNENDNQNATTTGTSNKWVGIFSPVLNFLNNTNEEGEETSQPRKESPRHASPKVLREEVEKEAVIRDSDGDITMSSVPENTTLQVNVVDDKSDPGSVQSQNQTQTATPTSAASLSVSLSHSQTSMDATDTTEEYADAQEDVAIQHEDEQDHHQDEYEYSGQFRQEEIHEEDEDEDEEDEFNPYLFIKFLPSYHTIVPRPEDKICLPPKDKSDPPITLVLDLDETLVHCTVEPIQDASMVFPVYFNGIQYSVHVRTRPFLTEFLESVSKNFEVVVFTASQQVYADELLNRIDPEGKYIKHRLFRESCLLVEGNYLKDLNVLGRDLTKCVLVDNSPHAFGYQVENGIPIESWFDDPKDIELMKLERFVNTLHGVVDVRSVVRSKFQTYKLIREAR
jgi:CTD small phosphatase-like protein 2